jgi:glycogen synthase
MRVAMLTNLFPPAVLGGYELLARDVAEGLRGLGHDVDVLTARAPLAVNAPIDDPPWVRRCLAVSRRFGAPAARDRGRHLVAAALNRFAIDAYVRERGAPDVVLAMSQRRLGLEPLRAFARRGVPTVLTVNDDWPEAYVALTDGRGAMLDRLVGGVHTWKGVTPSRVLFLSDAIRARVIAAGAPLPEGRVVPQGVDARVFPPRAFRPMRAAPHLVCVGRLHPSKAPDVALDALASLRARGVDAKLTMAGVGPTPAEDAEYREHAETKGVGDAVTWAGLVPRAQLVKLLHDADALMFLTRWDGEAQGLTHLEAMSAGVPVVAYALGGALELLSAHPVAELAARCDGDAMGDAVMRLLGDEALQRARVEAGVRLVREACSLDRYVAAVERACLEAFSGG